MKGAKILFSKKSRPVSRVRGLPRYEKICELGAVLFTPLESPAIYGRDNIDKASLRARRPSGLAAIPYGKGGVKAPSFLTGLLA